MHRMLYCAHSAGGTAMNIAQIHCPKAGHAAKPPPGRERPSYSHMRIRLTGTRKTMAFQYIVWIQ